MLQKKMENVYHPRRLTFIQVEDMCMFCDNPKGKTLTYTVYPEMLMGYISCPNCESKAEEAIKIWNEQLSYGRLHYLKDNHRHEALTEILRLLNESY